MYKIKTNKIKKYIKINKLTDKEFCSLCNISMNTLQKIMNNKVDWVALFKISIVMKIHIIDLLKK